MNWPLYAGKIGKSGNCERKRKAEFDALRKEISNRPSGKIKPIMWISGMVASVILALGFWWFLHTATLNPVE